ncbi:predicted protein [Nematostella vectensis]|uniref:Centromere protein L n=2 Tax=Nematostella vectensis TaxID=45351 RepID=A7S9W5_NEMVE|nr:predicted protein [Nematostella vectensis]|eukprot:XP_001631557.1 predicted protein [Nematostella vectensis]
MSDDAFKTHFVSLPVCLAKGTVALTRYVLSWLERQFDCRITPMVFSPSELSWYSSLWAGTVPKESEHLLELCYKVPTGIRGLRQITLSVNASDARELWECMHPSDSDIFNEEESVFFMHSLESHFYHHFKISLGSMSLSRIANSLVFIGGEGRLKILHAGYVRHVLQQITQAAAEREILARL